MSLIKLFGGYRRYVRVRRYSGEEILVHTIGRMDFLFRRRAERYTTGWFAGIDSYARNMDPEIEFVPGKWMRKG